jgi:hypothetical protein
MAEATTTSTFSIDPLHEIGTDQPGESLVLVQAVWPRNRYLARYVGMPMLLVVFVSIPALVAGLMSGRLWVSALAALGAAAFVVPAIKDLNNQLVSLSLSKDAIEAIFRSFGRARRVRITPAAVHGLTVTSFSASETDAGGELPLDLAFTSDEGQLLGVEGITIRDLNRVEEVLDFGQRLALIVGLERYRVQAGDVRRRVLHFARTMDGGEAVPARLERARYDQDPVPAVPTSENLAPQAPAFERTQWRSQSHQVVDHVADKRVVLERPGDATWVMLGYGLMVLFALIGLSSVYLAVARHNAAFLGGLIFLVTAPLWGGFVYLGSGSRTTIDAANMQITVDGDGMKLDELVRVELKKQEIRYSSSDVTYTVAGVRHSYRISVVNRQGRRMTLVVTDGDSDGDAVYRLALPLAAEVARMARCPLVATV